MGVVPAISAGVSLIGGIANVSAKNKAAEAQRQAITNESYQRAQQQQANEATLLAQQQLAQQQYQNSTLARLAQFQQTELGLQAQDQQRKLQAQQQAYSLQAGRMQQILQASQQGQQLDRQATSVQVGANAQRQASDLEQAQLAEAMAGQSQQITQALTAEERKQKSLEATGMLGNSSNQLAKERELMKRISSSLEAGLGIDKTVLARELQALNEEDIITIGERLGLLDNAAAVDTVAANLRMMNTSTNAGLEAVDRNSNLQRGAIDIARQQNLMSGQLDQQNALDAYTAQDYSLGVQRSLGQASATQVANNLASAYSNTRGATFMDWLNTGASVYGAVSPLLNRPSSPTRRPDFLTGANGFGSSGITDTESMNAQYAANVLQPDLSAGFSGTTQLRIPGLR